MAKLLTMTAPRAVIKKDGQTIGLIKAIRATETLNRGSVRGLGTIYESERPVLTFQGTWNCDFIFVDLVASGIPGMDNRNITSTEIYEQTKVLFEDPVDIYMYKKTIREQDDNGNVTGVTDSGLAVLRNCYLDSMSFDITEGAVSSHNQSGVYTKSIIIPSSVKPG